ncbi:MAG: type IIA DNA topoisomerase subunit B [Phycisphaeraceae bacterium]|nr:type IIA DNA topoisomerase subunit B [Phycisphaeraceae bacterium]
MTATYSAKDITVLEGLEPVRKRPGMYIGGVGPAGLHHLVWEIVDNCVDEAMNGHAGEISVTMHADGTSITVSDNGRGIPVDMHPVHRKPALEIILCTLHAGGKFEHNNYKTAGGLHGVGASVVNALSAKLTATVKRDGQRFEQSFEAGKPVGKLKKLGPARGSGTTIYFHPDPTIFPSIEFNSELIRQRLEVISYLHRGVKVSYEDQVAGQSFTFKHERGLLDFLGKLTAERKSRTVHEQAFSLSRDNGGRLEVALQWTEATDECVRSYVNGIPTGSGGTHENGLRGGISKAIRNYIETHKLQPKGVTIGLDDIREGLVAIISIFIADPQFQGQTKDRLNNPEAQNSVDAAIRQGLEHWLNHNRSMAEAIVARIILSARARAASRAAASEITRKTATTGRLNLPGKLADCSSRRSDETELFIVEGDSAGGSAKQGRDRTRQAILPLRGKVLNTEQASMAKVLDNRELSDIIQALGCGIGPKLNLDGLRYGKVILLMDADSDGHHIATLLLTFFYRHMRELIAAGKVYLAQPPLYRIEIGKQTFWAADDTDRDRIFKQHLKGNQRPEVTRFKGLGEMMARTLWDTTLNPATRRLIRVDISDGLASDRIINELMGKDASARFTFIMERAEEAQELDL